MASLPKSTVYQAQVTLPRTLARIQAARSVIELFWRKAGVRNDHDARPDHRASNATRIAYFGRGSARHSLLPTLTHMQYTFSSYGQHSCHGKQV